MKMLLAAGLCASLLFNAVLLLQGRRDPAPVPVVRTQVLERVVAAPPIPADESIPVSVPPPAPIPPPPPPTAPRPVVSLLASPAYVAPGGEIAVQCIVSSGATSAEHWIGLYPIHAHVSNHAGYLMVVPAAGPFLFKAPRNAGEYEFRYVLGDNQTSVAVSNPVRVLGEPVPPARVELQVGAAVVKCGAEISAIWFLLSGRRSSQDWIGIFPPEARQEDFVSWKYVPAGDRGQMALQAPDKPGTYEFRYLLDNGYECAAVSARILVVE